MIRLVQDLEISTHTYDDSGEIPIMHTKVKKVEQFIYDSEKTKEEHRKEKEAEGFKNIYITKDNKATFIKEEDFEFILD